jgi:glycosyltransferase involved in cell wall biosynthesis
MTTVLPPSHVPIDATIIICTRNRAEILHETLIALEQIIVLPSQSIELLVVDNGSTDATRSVIESFQTAKFDVHYLSEKKRGVANARNAGVTAATSEICIFLDDDVRPSASWLQEHLKCFDDPRVAAAQGKLGLQFDTPPPVWIEQIHRDFLAEKNPGAEPIFPYTQHLVSANMSFRRSVAVEIGLFCPLLGAGRSGFWEDPEFSERLMRAGYLQMYLPEAAALHIVPTARLTYDYFKDAAFRNGISTYMAEALGTLNTKRRPYRDLIYANVRHVKMKIKARLRGERYECTQDDLFYRMHMGVTWAYFLGMKRLTRRYSR